MRAANSSPLFYLEMGEADTTPQSYCKTYTYDLAGNRTGFTLEKGGETVHNISYSYDNLNRLSTVSENGAANEFLLYATLPVMKNILVSRVYTTN